MSIYRFKFNKKTIRFNIDETKPFRHYEEGWFSIGCHAIEMIEKSDIFDEADKKRILTLSIYQIYKMLRKL